MVIGFNGDHKLDNAQTQDICFFQLFFIIITKRAKINTNTTYSI